MAKNDGFNIFWQWFLLIMIPPVDIILLKEFGKAIYEVAGFGYAFLFYAGGIIIIVADLVILIIKTWDYLKPIIDYITEIIKTIGDLFRR